MAVFELNKTIWQKWFYCNFELFGFLLNCVLLGREKHCNSLFSYGFDVNTLAFNQLPCCSGNFSIMSPCFFNAWWVRSFELSKVILQIVHLLLSNSSSKCLSEKKQKSIILILDWRLYNPGRFLGSGLEKYNDWKTERNNHSWAKFKIVLVRKLERKFYYFMAKFQGNVRSEKNNTKRSSNTLLRLVLFFSEQTLFQFSNLFPFPLLTKYIYFKFISTVCNKINYILASQKLITCMLLL